MVQTSQSDVLIVGAGMSGLMAARVLTEAGLSTILVDKGRSVGGRMATRRIGDGAVDHGAQFFTARDAEFQALVDAWVEEGIAFEWARGWSDGSIVDTRDGHSRYACHGGMNQLAKHLAQGLDARVGIQLSAIRAQSESWIAESADGRRFQARALLMTPPVTQSLALFETTVRLTDDDRQTLDGIEYHPNLTVIAALDRPVRLPHPGAIQRPHANIHWIADNQRKGISPNQTLLTMQASVIYSRQLWDRTDDEVFSAFKVDLMPLLGDAQVVEMQLQRWRYSQPVEVYPDRVFVAHGDVPPLAFAGDAFGGPRVEGAALSGLAAGRLLRDRLKA